MRRPSVVFLASFLLLLPYFGVSLVQFFSAIFAASFVAVGARFALGRFFRIPIPPNAAVLVTGTSSGIGRTMVLHLLQNNFSVIATVRKDSDKDSLLREAQEKNLPAPFVIILDVSLADDISRGVSSVKEYLVKNQLSLYALVNNAGISVSGPLESIDMTKYRHGFEVNFFGPLLMTRAFLPLLRMGQKSTNVIPRIVNVGSPVGLFSYPFASLYSTSKNALGTLTESLRMETRYPCILLEPGGFRTNIWNTQHDKAKEEHYATRMERSHSFKAEDFKTPEPVAEDLMIALLSRFPPHRISTGIDSQALGVAGMLVPDSVWYLYSLLK